MSTTALVSELLVGGILTMTWIILGLMGVFERKAILELLAANQLTTGAVFLAYSYALGVVLDRFWDILTKPIDKRTRRKLEISDDEIKELRRAVFSDKDQTPEYIEYIRSRMRIARATLCNAIFLTLSGLFLYFRIHETPQTVHAVSIALVGCALTLLSYVAFNKLLNTYYKQLQTIGGQKPAAPAPPSQQLG